MPNTCLAFVLLESGSGQRDPCALHRASWNQVLAENAAQGWVEPPSVWKAVADLNDFAGVRAATHVRGKPGLWWSTLAVKLGDVPENSSRNIHSEATAYVCWLRLAQFRRPLQVGHRSLSGQAAENAAPPAAAVVAAAAVAAAAAAAPAVAVTSPG